MSLSEPPAQLTQLRLSGPDDDLEGVAAELFEAGAGGLLEEAGSVSVYAQSQEELDAFLHVANQFPHLNQEIVSVSSDWQGTWQRTLRPEKISASFTLRPTHCPKTGASDEEPDHETIWFEPEMSFGSGEHPTTRLAARWIEEICRAKPGLRCFDVGTGTGALAFVALKSGAAHAVAVDVDEIALRSVIRNAELNGLSGSLTIMHGSADATMESFPVVVANINTHILREICQDLVQRVATGGKLLLTGLLAEDISELVSLFESEGLRLQEKRADGQWALLSLVR